MIHPTGYNNYIFTILFAALFIVLPASAFTVAMYGTNSGFNPDLHKDSVVVVRSIPGSSGSDLDNNVDQFTDPSVDVIVLGGEMIRSVWQPLPKLKLLLQQERSSSSLFPVIINSLRVSRQPTAEPPRMDNSLSRLILQRSCQRRSSPDFPQNIP